MIRDKGALGASPMATGLAGAEAPEPHSRLGPSDGIPSAQVTKDEYVGRYLRAFDKQLEGVDLRSAVQTADAHFEHSPDHDPEEDAREEADCWREAS